MQLLFQIGVQIVSDNSSNREQLTFFCLDDLFPILMIKTKSGQYHDQRKQQNNAKRRQLCFTLLNRFLNAVPDFFHPLRLPQFSGFTRLTYTRFRVLSSSTAAVLDHPQSYCGSALHKP